MCMQSQRQVRQASSQWIRLHLPDLFAGGVAPARAFAMCGVHCLLQLVELPQKLIRFLHLACTLTKANQHRCATVSSLFILFLVSLRSAGQAFEFHGLLLLDLSVLHEEVQTFLFRQCSQFSAGCHLHSKEVDA